MLIETGDTALHVRVEGSGTAVLLLVHGFPFHGGMWDAQLGALPDGWRGLAPDLRGFGESPAGDREDWSMDLFADDLALLLDGLDLDAVTLCGLSMGGYVAFAFWRRHRDRVRALVLADTRAGADDEAGRANRRAVAEEVLEKGSGVVAQAMVPKLLAPGTRAGRPDVVARVRAMIRGTEPRTIARTQLAMAARPDSVPDLPGIDVPTLVVAGSEDALTGPDTARSLADGVPGARLDIIPGAGHLSPMERPDAFNRVLGDWLRAL